MQTVMTQDVGVNDLPWKIDYKPERCTMCGSCVASCSFKAIKVGVQRRDMTVSVENQPKPVKRHEARPVIMGYRVLFSLITFVGATTTLEIVWNFSDTMNGLMIIPNLICLLWLSNDIAKECFEYQEAVVVREKNGEDVDYCAETDEIEAAHQRI